MIWSGVVDIGVDLLLLFNIVRDWIVCFIGVIKYVKLLNLSVYLIKKKSLI